MICGIRNLSSNYIKYCGASKETRLYSCSSTILCGARRHFLNLGSCDPAKRIIGKLLSQGPHKKCCHFNYKKKNHKNNHPERVHRATEEAETNFVTRTQVLLTLMYNCCNFYIDGLICCVAMVKLCCSFKVLK